MKTNFNFNVSVTYWNDNFDDQFTMVPGAFDDDLQDKIRDTIASHVNKHSIKYFNTSAVELATGSGPKLLDSESMR